MNNKKHALYRHYDKSGTLLYIGISNSVLVRLSRHKHSSSWLEDAVRMDTEYFKDKPTAEREEALAIKREKPKFNIRYNNDKPFNTVKLKEKVLNTTVRVFDELTLPEKRLIWSCVAIKNDEKEREELMHNFKHRELDFIDKFVITDHYFSKLFGIDIESSANDLLLGGKALSKCNKVIDNSDETTNFIVRKMGWIEIVSVGSYRDIRFPCDRNSVSKEFIAIIFNNKILDKFQDTPIKEGYITKQIEDKK